MMHKSQIKELLPEPKPNKELKDDGTSVRQTIAKPNVGCCTSMQTLKENILNSDILSENTKIIVGAFIDIQLEYEQKQIVDAFTAGQIDIAKALGEAITERYVEKITVNELENDKEDGEQYFNNTFKK